MDQRFAVTVREAGKMIPASHTKTYELIGEGRLERVKLGRKSLITMRSIRRLHEEMLAAAGFPVEGGAA